MQIRDMLGQYSQNVKNGTEELMSAQGTQKLVSSMQELEPGSTFAVSYTHLTLPTIA